MENHVYKPHWRHGHHHHKNNTFYALLAMVFFALITLGVVASIFYNITGSNSLNYSLNSSSANTVSETELAAFPQCRENITQSLRPDATTYVDPAWNFEMTYPAEYSLHSTHDCQIPGWPQALAVLYCSEGNCPSYAMAIEIWDSPAGFRNTYGHDPDATHYVHGSYLTFWNISKDPAVDEIINSVKLQ